MLESANFEPDQSADEWAARSEFWIAESARSVKPMKRRERNSNPLILTGHGNSLRIENGALAIRQGFSHYPQVQQCHRYFPGSRDIPERILILDGSGSLSFDVLSWLGEQGVTLARIKWTGEVAIVASGTGYATDRAKVDWQIAQRDNDDRRMAFSIDLVTRKLIGSVETLESHIGDSAKRNAAIDWHRDAIARLANGSVATIDDLLGIEGRAAAVYFGAWLGFDIRWTGKRPVPDDWRHFDIRSSMANGSKPCNANASHPLNAMLNYAYAVKLAQIQIEAIAQGYDPTIGIMHRGRRGKPSYIFDLIEPERPKVDATILGFVRTHIFTASDFVIRSDGCCRLSPQLARTISSLVAS